MGSLIKGAAVTCLLVLFVVVGLHGLEGVSREAVVCEGVCREILKKTTEGRQALVSSVWWAPLPVLLRLPLAALFRTQVLPLSSLFVSAVFGVGTLLLLEQILRKWHVGWTRWAMVGALAFHPEFTRRCADGSSATTIIFLVCLASYGLVKWVEGRQLRFLVHLALASALLVMTSFEMWTWLIMASVLLIVDLAAFSCSREQKQAVLIVVFLPLAYALALWALMNWLIMGDGLYFMRSLLAGASAWQELPAPALRVSSFHVVAAGIAVLTLVTAAQSRHLAGVFIGVLGLSPILVMNFLATRRLFWAPTVWEYTLFPLFIMVVGYLGEFSSVLSARLRACAASLPVVVAALALFSQGVGPAEPAGGGNYEAVLAERNQWLPRIERHVTAQSRYVKVFVCGYDSFLLLGPNPSATFIHALDFNFYRAKEDYAGHILYVLVHRPAGRSAMDSIHWKYDRIFTLGSRDTLYDGDWGNWRLFELIQARR